VRTRRAGAGDAVLIGDEIPRPCAGFRAVETLPIAHDWRRFHRLAAWRPGSGQPR